MESVDLALFQADHRVPADLQIVGMRDLEEGQRLDLFAAITKHGGESRIGLQDAAVEADDGDADRRILHGAAEPLFALADLPAVLDDLANEQGGEEKRRRDHRDRYLQAEFQGLGAELQARQQDRRKHGDKADHHQNQRSMSVGPQAFPSPRHNADPPRCAIARHCNPGGSILRKGCAGGPGDDANRQTIAGMIKDRCALPYQRTKSRPPSAPSTVRMMIATVYQVATKSGESSTQCAA